MQPNLPEEPLLSDETILQLLANGREYNRVFTDQGYEAAEAHRQTFAPVVRFFEPICGHSWLVSGIDPEALHFVFGLHIPADDHPALEHFRLSDLACAWQPLGLQVRRDPAFSPDRPLGAYADEARQRYLAAKTAFGRPDAPDLDLPDKALVTLLDNGRKSSAALERGLEHGRDAAHPFRLSLMPVVMFHVVEPRRIWLLAEMDTLLRDCAWTLCDLGNGAVGFEHIPLEDLFSARRKFGLCVERHRTFQPDKTIGAYLAEARELGRVSA